MKSVETSETMETYFFCFSEIFNKYGWRPIDFTTISLRSVFSLIFYNKVLLRDICTLITITGLEWLLYDIMYIYLWFYCLKHLVLLSETLDFIVWNIWFYFVWNIWFYCLKHLILFCLKHLILLSETFDFILSETFDFIIWNIWFYCLKHSFSCLKHLVLLAFDFIVWNIWFYFVWNIWFYYLKHLVLLSETFGFIIWETFHLLFTIVLITHKVWACKNKCLMYNWY